MTDDWQDMNSAPKDGTIIVAEIPGVEEETQITWIGGLVVENGDEAYSWACIEEYGWPDSWTDGVCWGSNAEGQPSVLPTRWKPLPEPPKC